MNKARILVVDDEPGIRNTIGELLELNDYQVENAANGKEALRKIAKFRPNLILCDWMMPEMDGLELLHETRQLPTYHGVPFVFITAKTDREDARLAMGLGADDFITKPFKATELVEAIEAKLNRFNGFRRMLEEQQISLPAHFSKFGFHEFNTPMNAFIGGLDFLTEYDAVLSSAERLELIGNMRMATYRLKRAYSNLLIFTKIMRGEAIYSFNSTCSANESYTKALKRLLITRPDIQLVATIKEVRLPLHEEALELMLYELIDNAIKFGEMEAKPTVVGALMADGLRYRLQVQNEGEGMSASEIASIGPMVQFRRECNEQQGWGLGLYLVKALCEANELHFSITSSSERTIVAIDFPLS